MESVYPKDKSGYSMEIWHEIFQVNEGQFTRVYNGLPVYGTTRMIQIMPFMAIREKAI